jgi:Cd2+/Zn2+-exporting ATPase
MINTIKNNKCLHLQTRNVIISLILILIALFFSSEGNSGITVLIWGASFIIGGYYKAVEGYKKTIESKALNVEILMIVAALAAFLTQDYREGAILIFIFAASGVMETYANTKSEKALTSLLELSPKTAIKIIDNKETEVNIDELVIDDIVVVKVGQQVPVDGIIIKGTASINQAAITGESIPITKKVGDDVFAGSLNEDSTIYVRVIKSPKDSTMQKIIDFVKEAQENKTKSQSFIERFERWYVYVVIALAGLFMFVPYTLGWLTFHDSLLRGVIVLVVGSPCAVVASITPAILSALSYGATHGILIKGGEHLERLVDVTTIIFDKTGTLTTGKPKVQDVIVESVDKDELIPILVNIERSSNHPLANAISLHFKDIKQVHISTKEIPGKGMQATVDGHDYSVGRFDASISDSLKQLQVDYIEDGQTLVSIIKDNVLIGFVSLKDTVRDSAKKVVEKLNALNIQTVLLTGDQEHTAQAIARETGVRLFEFNCLPECKSDFVEKYKSEKQVVMMIGDGINDAPSLAVADVGAAMGDATDVSLETSDIVFINNDLQNVIRVHTLAKKTRRIINQNLIFSISVITLLLLSNVLNMITLPLGVLAHEGSTILVILNSLRLLQSID